MEVVVGGGSLSQSIGLDTYSLHYFEMDGCSFCGGKVFDINPQLDWVSASDCSVTIESYDP